MCQTSEPRQLETLWSSESGPEKREHLDAILPPIVLHLWVNVRYSLKISTVGQAGETPHQAQWVDAVMGWLILSNWLSECNSNTCWLIFMLISKTKVKLTCQWCEWIVCWISFEYWKNKSPTFLCSVHNKRATDMIYLSVLLTSSSKSRKKTTNKTFYQALPWSFGQCPLCKLLLSADVKLPERCYWTWIWKAMLKSTPLYTIAFPPHRKKF